MSSRSPFLHILILRWYLLNKSFRTVDNRSTCFQFAVNLQRALVLMTINIKLDNVESINRSLTRTIGYCLKSMIYRCRGVKSETGRWYSAMSLESLLAYNILMHRFCRSDVTEQRRFRCRRSLVSVITHDCTKVRCVAINIRYGGTSKSGVPKRIIGNLCFQRGRWEAPSMMCQR